MALEANIIKPKSVLALLKLPPDEDKLLSDSDPFERLLFGETLEIAPISNSEIAFRRASKW